MLEIEAWILAHMAYKNTNITRVWSKDDLKKWADSIKDEQLKNRIREYYRMINEKRNQHTER